MQSRSFLFYSVLCITVAVCLVQACKRKSPEDIKFQQYYVQGEVLYETHCSNCHQQQGTGLGLVYPPLNPSDYVDENFESVLCLMRHGIRGELVVNGKTYVQPMPGIPTLTDLEIAEIATYIYNTWGRSKGLIDVKDVSKVLGKCD